MVSSVLMCHLSTKFCENWLRSLCVIPLTKKEKEKHNKNMISSVEIITKVQVQRVIACEYTYECIML